MSNSKKVLNVIYFVIILIQLSLLLLLAINHPLPEYMEDILPLLKWLMFFILTIFTFAVICYIVEHKKYNKNEYVLDNSLISPKFDISIRSYDITYLSTILNQKYPCKKDIILLIMQLINKKVIDLECSYDGNNYQYIIKKRNNYMAKITNTEKSLINYLFYESNSVNLINKIKQIYSTKNLQVIDIEKALYSSIEESQLLKVSSIKMIYKSFTFIIAVLAFFIGTFILLTTSSITDSITPIKIVTSFILIALVCIFMAFLCTFVLKKLNAIYQYNNDTFSWVFFNITFINLFLMVSYAFPLFFVIQYFIMLIYIFTALTIMIKYNVHISLSKDDVIIRNRLLSLKKYFNEMNYLKDKEFSNIITYEECIMYGFLFNITIKINEEFDLLQKELVDIIRAEGKLYLNLFKDSIDSTEHM